MPSATIDMVNVRIVMTAVGSKEEAQRIAHSLVEGGLAACVNILPQMESVYRWKGKVERAEEWLLLAKTTEQRAAEVVAEIQRLHSYELPEVLILNPEGGSLPYVKWVEESCS